MIQTLNKNKHGSFAKHNEVCQYNNNERSIMVMYYSGAGGHYIIKKDWCKVGLPILWPSTHQVGASNWGTSKVKYVTQLPLFQKLSVQAMQADTFHDFPASLMSIGKTAVNDDGTISTFTKQGITVRKEEDYLLHA